MRNKRDIFNVEEKGALPAYRSIHLDMFRNSEKYPLPNIQKAIEMKLLRTDKYGHVIDDYFFQRIKEIGFKWQQLNRWDEPIGLLFSTRRGYTIFKAATDTKSKNRSWVFAQVFTPDGRILFFMRFKSWLRNYREAKNWIDMDDIVYKNKKAIRKEFSAYGLKTFKFRVLECLIVKRHLPHNRETLIVHNKINQILEKYGFDIDKPLEELEDDYRQVTAMVEQGRVAENDSI
jgi:hypothetical protein